MRASLYLPSAPSQPNEAIVATAIDWLIRLRCDDCANVRAACQRWRAQHPDHELAWQRICTLEADFSRRRQQIDGQAASSAVEQVLRRDRRRQVLKKGGIGLSCLLLLAAWQRRPLENQWHILQADLRTPTGGQRQVTLPDGTQMLLNTGTAVDIRYDDTARTLLLHQGEIHIATAPDARQRPFAVITAEGRVMPIGTRFTVRSNPETDRTAVQVLAGAVELYPADAPDRTTRLEAGQGASFNRQGATHAAALPNTAAAWVDGILAAEDMRLDDFLDELGRYRNGWLRCHPDVAALRLTGTFPLQDTDRILASLPRFLPVRIQRKSRYWISVVPRA